MRYKAELVQVQVQVYSTEAPFSRGPLAFTPKSIWHISNNLYSTSSNNVHGLTTVAVRGGIGSSNCGSTRIMSTILHSGVIYMLSRLPDRGVVVGTSGTRARTGPLLVPKI